MAARLGHRELTPGTLAAAMLLGLAGGAGAETADNTPMPRPAQLGSPEAAATPGPDTAALAGPALDPAAPESDTAPTVPPQISSSVITAATAEALAQAVLTVDQEAIYRGSAWGRRAERLIADQTRQVAADNEKAFAALVAEEDALTAARPTLSAEEFRTRAAAFDEHVTAVRAEREAARLELSRSAERDRALFVEAAAPVLGKIMSARGALVVLDQRAVLISDRRIDVTAATIAELDEVLGDGAAIVAKAEAAAAARPAEAADTSGSAVPGNSLTKGATP